MLNASRSASLYVKASVFLRRSRSWAGLKIVLIGFVVAGSVFEAGSARAVPPTADMHIAVEEGAFFLVDAQARDSRAAAYLAFWDDDDTGNLYVYGHLIRTDADVSLALLALEAQVAPVLDSLIEEDPQILAPETVVVGGASGGPRAEWSLATHRVLDEILAKGGKP